MSIFKSTVGTRCLGQVDAKCQSFINRTQLPPHKRHCPICGSTVADITANNKPIILAVLAIGIVTLCGAAFLVYQKVVVAGVGAVRNLRPPGVLQAERVTGGSTDQKLLGELEKLTQDGDFEGVQKRGEEYLARNPADPTVLNNVAAAALRQGKVDAARGYLKRAIDLKPNDGYLRYNLGCVEARSGNKSDAVSNLKRACQLGLAPANFRQDPDLASLAEYAPFEQLIISKTCQ